MAPPTYTPRAWHLVIVAMIVVLDLIVLYMVIRPNVTDDYRAYYIDRSASCFPRADNVATGYYPLGEPISFVPDRSGFLLDTIRWCGFMPPSNTGIRSFGDYGVLRIKMPLPDDDFLLTVARLRFRFGHESMGALARFELGFLAEGLGFALRLLAHQPDLFFG